jgi:hypothetical protein
MVSHASHAMIIKGLRMLAQLVAQILVLLEKSCLSLDYVSFVEIIKLSQLMRKDAKLLPATTENS